MHLQAAGTFVTKYAVALFVAGYAGLNAAISMTWLPVDWLSAAILGLIGGLLQLSVPWVINSQDRPGPVRGTLIVLTGAAIAVFFNGTNIPFLSHMVDPDARWRVNTLMLAFIGLGVPLWFLNVFNKLSKRTPG